MDPMASEQSKKGKQRKFRFRRKHGWEGSIHEISNSSSLRREQKQIKKMSQKKGTWEKRTVIQGPDRPYSSRSNDHRSENKKREKTIASPRFIQNKDGASK